MLRVIYNCLTYYSLSNILEVVKVKLSYQFILIRRTSLMAKNLSFAQEVVYRSL